MATKTTARKSPMKDNLRATVSGELVSINPDVAKPEVSEALIRSQTQKAITEFHSGVKLRGSAEQRMSYAAMAKHEWLVFRTAAVGTLTEMIDSQQARETFLNHIAEEFLGVEPDPKGEKTEDHLTAIADYKAVKAMLLRAMKIAGTMKLNGVKLSDFDEVTGNWRVPFPRLFKSTDRIQFTEAQTARTVLLDRTTWQVTGTASTGKDKPVRIQASMIQWLAVHAPTNRKPRAEGNKDDATKLSAEVNKLTGGKLAEFTEVNPVIEAFHIKLVEEGSESDTFDIFTPEGSTDTKFSDLMRSIFIRLVRIDANTKAAAKAKAAA